MKAVKDPNYSEAQEATIRAAAAEGPLNLDRAKALGEQIGKSTRSVIAKIGRMGLAYETKQPTTKTGDPVTSKAKLVEQISAVVAGNLTGLEKAPKPALHALARFAAASRASAEG